MPWAAADAAALAGLRARALGPRPTDKAAQQLLFEFAVTYDALAMLPRLVAAGFRHARKAEFYPGARRRPGREHGLNALPAYFLPVLSLPCR